LQANVLSEQRQNTSNLLLSIIFLQMVVQWLIMKAQETCFNYWKWNLLLKNIRLTCMARGWLKSCTRFCWKPLKRHL
jgi:hypothetical protein